MPGEVQQLGQQNILQMLARLTGDLDANDQFQRVVAIQKLLDVLQSLSQMQQASPQEQALQVGPLEQLAALDLQRRMQQAGALGGAGVAPPSPAGSPALLT